MQRFPNVLVLLVDHKEFKSINSKSLEGMVVVDTRGVLEAWAKK